MQIFTYKSFDEGKDKMLLSIVAIALAVYMALSCSYFSAAAGSVRGDVVRLHILANSDSRADQRVKLLVRDALLKANSSILKEGVTTENAEHHFKSSRKLLLETAEKVLRENGFSYDVAVTLEDEYFETRKYGELTFPAGEYLSLKVILGEGKGKNWWCVMFPPLCVPAADNISADKEKAAAFLSQSGEKIINGGNKYIVKFKLLELFEELKSGIR